MEVADLHNFGQSVQKIGRGSESFFQKPRPIYWEWLLFGRSSPLSPYFEKSRVQEIAPSDVIFNLVTEIGENYCEQSSEVVAYPSAEVLPSHFYSLGALLAYCYIFGIRDLHRYNLIKTKNHLQVVDAEVVLSKLILPHETLLLPFKDVGPNLCGASSFMNFGEERSSKELEMIFSGYVDVFENVIENLSEIQKVFDVLTEIEKIPVRHILRDTFHYRAWKKNVPPIPFFASELSQLERGDIPYYFKFIGHPKVYEYTKQAGNFEAVNLPEIFLKGAAREASLPTALLAEERIRNQLFGPGLLYLAKIFLLKSERSLQANGYSIVFKNQEISISSSLGSFAAHFLNKNA